VLKAVLDKNLSYGDLDMTLVRVEVEGEAEGEQKKLRYQIVDRQDSREGLTSMMRMTAFPAAIIALMAARGQLKATGCKPQEIVVNPTLFMPELKKRNIKLDIDWL
jgi:saccharopine dehydrogenase-like NADP-dependent oxidoreductase